MSRDMRNYAKQTNFRLIVGGIILVFLIGDGLVYLIYGPAAAVSGLLCIGAGLVPLALILIVFWVMDLIVKKANQGE